MEKKPSGKKLEVFLLMIFLWGSKILRKQGDFLKFTRLRPCAFHDFLLEKHKAQTTPLKLILRYENPIQEIQETCAALDHSPGRNSTFLMDFGLIDFLCLGKILSSAVSACCFSEKPSKVVVFDGIFYRHQPVVIRPWKTSSFTLPLSRLKYSRRFNPCSSWWFRNPKQLPFVWKEPWILTGWCINWLAGVLKHQQYHFRLSILFLRCK